MKAAFLIKPDRRIVKPAVNKAKSGSLRTGFLNGALA
jgi:hypothetical protein